MDNAVFNLRESKTMGEARLRADLAGRAPWHLIDVIIANRMSSLHRADLNRLTREALTEIIVAGVLAA